MPNLFNDVTFFFFWTRIWQTLGFKIMLFSKFFPLKCVSWITTYKFLDHIPGLDYCLLNYKDIKVRTNTKNSVGVRSCSRPSLQYSSLRLIIVRHVTSRFWGLLGFGTSNMFFFEYLLTHSQDYLFLFWVKNHFETTINECSS